jgi:hypothetical protein
MIGIDSRRSVRGRLQLTLSLAHVSSAEGNPDEEKIGAFGVGGPSPHLEAIVFLTYRIHRLLQLVLGNRGAVGHVRRYADITLTNPLQFYSHLLGQWMNFYWKDKKDQVGRICKLYVKPHANTTIPAICPPRKCTGFCR